MHQASDMPLEFENGLVDFGFSRATGGDEQVTAHVRLSDPETYSEFTGGLAEVELPTGTSQKVWLSFSEFGWRDDAMTVPIDQCSYEVWLEGTDSCTIDVEVYVE